jgi:hypothetical protein
MPSRAPLKLRLRAKYALLKRRLHWAFVEPALGWLSLLLAGFSLYLLTSVRLEVCIRWWGMVLQLIGIGTVVHDLWSRIPKEQRKGPIRWLLAWSREWIARMPPRHFFAQVHEGLTLADSATGSDAITITRTGATLDQRVAVLESRMTTIDDSLDRARQGIAQERKAREASIRKMTADAAAVIAGIRSRVEDVAVGTLPVSMFGVWWLAVGVVLSTAAPELVRWAGYMVW